MTLVSYFQQFVAPYARARWGASDDLGASLVEYALLVALIAVVCIVAVTFIGNNASSKLSKTGSTLGN